ncbi:MAG: PQQ-dependent sugar dehydrogenase [Kutzneria sp.]|nr:PQQ-dependent sugar dehydrogenase [Kutzneria sp.]
MRCASGVILPTVVIGLLAVGCASFPEQAGPPPTWQPQPKLTEQAGPQPNLPGGANTDGAPRPGPATSIPPPQGCTDFDPAVIGTCLEPIAAVAALPGGTAGLAAERSSGRVLAVQRGAATRQVAAFSVDAATGGGLTGLALSPTYREDQLLYVYLTTATDNRVVRFTAGDAPKPILTGIPKGQRDNRGVMATDRTGALLVATGDAGDPAAASDPKSLAGKVLRIDGLGKPAPGNPDPTSVVIASGLSSPAGLCGQSEGAASWWVTDQAAAADQLYKVTFGQPVGTPAWSWPDRPGVAGCAAFTDQILVATAHRAGLQLLALNKDGSFNGKPTVVLDDEKGYGQICGVDAIDDQTAVIGTVNKDGGVPVSSDDRVVLLPKPNSSDARD